MARPARHTLVILVGAALLVLLPPIASATGHSFFISTFSRILIYALAAVSLDLILGYGGMVSFGHAAFFGIGAYVVGILAFHFAESSTFLSWPFVIHGTNAALIAWPAAIVISALAALVIGAISLRASGVFFIMITLAFAQMVYFLFVSLEGYGGDDGMNLLRRNDIPGLDLRDDTTFYYVVLVLLLGFVLLCRMLVNSRFGMVLQGCRENERRTLALGIPSYRYKLTAFVIAGAGAGLAGALLTNQALFVSPHVMEWRVSGEIMIMVILGGMGTLVGPVVGAMVFLLLSEFLGVRSLFGNMADHWQFVLGAVLILVVLYAPQGLHGWIFGRARAHG
ncbi:MAG TPA: branched-chain amino acid ABC transporter permease [Alphaproteobacteria bacterium]|nr:branched-chain amino acid ABC transporter permease [Alphaproteobacteria bacterium]